MKDNEVYKKHIIEAINRIKKYVEGTSYVGFSTNNMLVDAVVRQLEIIGEAANQMNEEFKEKHKEIPFNKIISMRNKLIHEYFGVDPEVVWETCMKDLVLLEKILNE